MSHTQSSIPLETTLADQAWCNQRYTVEGLGCPEIGALVERDASTVRYWLKKHGIPTRPRGTDERQLFKPGHVSPMTGRHHTEETKAKVGKASRERGAIPYLKDGKHYLLGKRGPETHTYKHGNTPERQATYSHTDWKAAQAAVWERDNSTCQRCGAVHGDGHKLNVHHITPFDADVTLRTAVGNLVLLCTKCHGWVHSRANTERQYLGDREQAEVAS